MTVRSARSLVVTLVATGALATAGLGPVTAAALSGFVTDHGHDQSTVATVAADDLGPDNFQKKP